jgi:hypothetical protein
MLRYKIMEERLKSVCFASSCMYVCTCMYLLPTIDNISYRHHQSRGCVHMYIHNLCTPCSPTAFPHFSRNHAPEICATSHRHPRHPGRPAVRRRQKVLKWLFSYSREAVQWLPATSCEFPRCRQNNPPFCTPYILTVPRDLTASMRRCTQPLSHQVADHRIE